MKKKIFILLALISINNYLLCQDSCFESFKVYHRLEIIQTSKTKKSSNFINLRNSPKGDIILKINCSIPCSFNVINFKDGWFQINSIYAFNNNLQGRIDFNGWIKSSLVGANATHSIILLNKPKGIQVGKVKGLVSSTFKIVDVQCNWVKIKTKGGLIGWTKSNRICGLPSTLCVKKNE